MRDVTSANAAIHGQTYRTYFYCDPYRRADRPDVTIVMPEQRYIYAGTGLRDVTIVVRIALGVRSLAVTPHFCYLFAL
nr:MAG TPA: hypothetical protein [Caudoviricetes sp.]